MASTASVPPQSLSSCQKTPVLVILADAVTALETQLHPHYINRLLGGLGEGPILAAFVTYGSIHCPGHPVSVIPFSLVRTHQELKRIPVGPTMGQHSLDMAALDGYVAAVKLIDQFRARLKPNSAEEFSYHLWHVAAGQHDEVEFPRFDFSPTFLEFSWDTVPDEIKKRNIHCSMILLKPCPKLSKLFRAISPMAVPPWFDICPYHEVLLSPGLVPPLQLGGATSSTAPAKRPLFTDTSVERRSRKNRRTEASPQSTPAPPLTGSPVAASAPAPHSPPNPPAGEIQAATADSWSGWLIWPRGGSEVYTRVQATDPVRNPRTSTWPTTLRLRIVEAGVSTLEIQEWIRKNKASTAVIKWADEADSPDFDELVKLVRKGGGYAIVQWEPQGKLSSLLLAPISKGLLCAAFPTTTMPAPPTPSQQPQQAAQPQAGQHPPANIPPAMLRQVQYLQGNLGGHQTNGLATGALVQPTRVSQQQFQMLQQQGVFIQMPPPLLPAQQDHQYQQPEPGSVDAQSALTASGGLVPGGGPVMTTDNVGGDAGIGSADANPAQWGMNGDLYEGAIDEAELGMMPSPTDGVTQDVSEIMFRLYTHKYDESV